MVKNLEDIRWQEILTPDRGTQQACSMGDAEAYLSLSKAGLKFVLDKYQIRRYSTGHGKTKYVLRLDLDRVNRLRGEMRIDTGMPPLSEQLLASAAVLLEQIKGSHEDIEEVEAIQIWLEDYRKFKE